MSEENCPICHLSMFSFDDSDICTTICKHRFHTSCLLGCRSDKCPLCRQTMTKHSVPVPNAGEILDTFRNGLREIFDELTKDPEYDAHVERCKKAEEIQKATDPELWNAKNSLFNGSKITKTIVCKASKK